MRQTIAAAVLFLGLHLISIVNDSHQSSASMQRMQEYQAQKQLIYSR